ncbi:MAG: hypothetical protein WBE34_04075 [Candidatus Nitrosopolaris sp.]
MTEIPNISQVKSLSNVGGDIVFLRLDAKKSSKNYIDEQIPFEPEKDIVALEGIKKRDGMALRGRHS